MSVFSQAFFPLRHFLEPKYSSNDTHFAYVNPSAPKGGGIRLKASNYDFDTLNPFSDWGISPPQIERTFATLMEAPLDDPAVLYPYVLDRFEKNKKSLTLFLNPRAVFHDQTPLRGEDVKVTLEWFQKNGKFSFRAALACVANMTVEDAHTVIIDFKKEPSEDELFTLLQLPILAASDLKQGGELSQKLPLKGSGPYRLSAYQFGQFVVYDRVHNWWGEALLVNKGRYNFDRVTCLFYRSDHAGLEGFKKGEYDLRHETRASFWENEYAFPAVQKGEVVRKVFPFNHHLGLNGLFINTNRGVLKKAKVRKALAIMFDFAWINQVMLFGFYRRNQSIFPNMSQKISDPLSAEERSANKAYGLFLPLEELSKEGDLWHRAEKLTKRERVKEALKLFEEAGLKRMAGHLVDVETGQKITVKIITNRLGTGRLLQFYVDDLTKLGIEVSLRVLDAATFQKMLKEKNYDLAHYTHLPSFFPTASQAAALWGSDSGNKKHSLNLSRVKNNWVDKVIDALEKAKTKEDLLALSQLLNRLIHHENYFIPMWSYDKFYVAYWDKFDHPKTRGATSLDTWWSKV